MAKKKNQENDIQELEDTFQNLSASKSPKKKGKYAKDDGNRSAVILTVCIVLLVVAALIGGFFVYNIFRDGQVISAKLTVAGFNVTGLTRKEAENKLQSHFNGLYSNNPLTVWIDENSVTIPYSESSVNIDAEAAINAAVSYRQSSQDTQALDVSDYIVINTDAVKAILQTFSPLYTSTLKQTEYNIVGNAPANYSGIDESASRKLIITLGQPGIQLDMDALLDTVIAGYSDGADKVEFHCPVVEPNALDIDALIAEHNVASVEAVMDLETFEVSGGTYGYGLDPESIQAAIDNATYGEEITVDFQWDAPAVTVEELEALLFRDVLAEYTTYASSNYDRNENLRLAAEAVNGTVMNPGDVFSYNNTLGERTPEKGYRPGASYVNGETVLDYGGGICQVTSTLYYCTIVADLKIIERECHGYASAYTPLSTDATVFWGGIDFKFENNTQYPIRIEASAEYGNVTVRLIGTDTKDYYVKFDSVWLDTYPYKTVYKEMKADNEKGFKDGDIITDPYTGYKSEGYRVRYDKTTGEEIERILESTDVYSSRDLVICKIIDEETEPATEAPTETPTTEAPTEAPVTTEPPTEPVTTTPPTEAPVTTEPPTEPPTTVPPTEPPTTTEPPTEPPATTEPPTEHPITTEAPTESPTTIPPTEPPTAAEPTAAATEESVTEAEPAV